MKGSHHTPLIFWPPLLIALPPFLIAGAFFPVSRFLWITLPLGAVLAFLFYKVLENILPVFIFPASLLSAALLFLLVLWGNARFLHEKVTPSASGLLFSIFLLLLAGSTLPRLQTHQIPVRLSAMEGPLIALLLFLSAAISFQKCEWFFLPDFTVWIPADTQPEFLHSLLIVFLIYSADFFMLLPERHRLSVSPFCLLRSLILAVLLPELVFLSASLALGPDLFDALPYPWYDAPGLDRRAGYLDRQEIFSLAALLLSLPTCLIWNLRTLQKIRPSQSTSQYASDLHTPRT